MLTYGSELLKKTATASFWNSYYEIEDPFAGLVYNRESTQSTDVYTRLGAAPMPDEWVGEQEAEVANEYNYSVENKAYRSAVKIDKKLIKFQQFDEISRLIGNLGAKARAHKTKLLSALLEAGFATVCEDGQYFFDDDHASAGAAYTTSQDNDLTSAAATGTQPTELEAAIGIRACMDAMYGFKDDQGDPMTPPSQVPQSDFVCMVPPVYKTIFERVARAESLTGPLGNELRGTFTVRVNPFLTGTDRFYFFYAGSNHKPLILQTSGGIELDDSMTGDEYFRSGNVNYSATWWGRAIYGQWRCAVGYIYS